MRCSQGVEVVIKIKRRRLIRYGEGVEEVDEIKGKSYLG